MAVRAELPLARLARVPVDFEVAFSNFLFKYLSLHSLLYTYDSTARS